MLELRKRGTQQGFGVSPITFTGIESFCNLKGIELDDEELDLILMADDEVVEILNKHEELRQKYSKGKS